MHSKALSWVCVSDLVRFVTCAFHFSDPARGGNSPFCSFAEPYTKYSWFALREEQITTYFPQQVRSLGDFVVFPVCSYFREALPNPP